jgi:hypothetical protein
MATAMTSSNIAVDNAVGSSDFAYFAEGGLDAAAARFTPPGFSLVFAAGRGDPSLMVPLWLQHSSVRLRRPVA